MVPFIEIVVHEDIEGCSRFQVSSPNHSIDICHTTIGSGLVLLQSYNILNLLCAVYTAQYGRSTSAHTAVYTAQYGRSTSAHTAVYNAEYGIPTSAHTAAAVWRHTIPFQPTQ